MCDEPTDTKAPKSFRFQNMRAFLTYSQAGHFDKKHYVAWLSSLSDPRIVTWVRLAHETGENGDNPHTHVLVEWDKALCTRNERFFDYQGHHPHIKTLNSKKAFEDAKKYLAKEDPENSDLKTPPSLVSRVFSHNTVVDALSELAIKPNDVNGIVQLFNLRPSAPLSRFHWKPSTPFHHRIIDLNNTAPDPRHVIWCYDFVGNIGKTNLSKWLQINYPNKWYVCKDLGTSRDAATTISGALKRGWESWGIIIDLPRSAEHHTRIYSYIEEIKDGMITSQKYEGRSEIFDVPHVVVMANWLPQIDSLSKDRWIIIDAQSNEQQTLNTVALLLNTNATSIAPPPPQPLRVLDIMSGYK